MFFKYALWFHARDTRFLAILLIYLIAFIAYLALNPDDFLDYIQKYFW